MNKQLIIGGTIAILLILVIVLIAKKKEKFTLNGSGQVPSSGSGTPLPALSYLSTDSNGNISVTNSGQFANVDIEGNLTLQGYSGKVGDVLVSNGSAPPVWAPGVGMSDFVGTNQSIGKTSGYQILPGGLIIQWGYVPSGWGSGDTMTFPIPFPNNCLSVTATTSYTGVASPSAANVIMVTNVKSNTFSVLAQFSNNFYWMAIGN